MEFINRLGANMYVPCSVSFPVLLTRASKGRIRGITPQADAFSRHRGLTD